MEPRGSLAGPGWPRPERDRPHPGPSAGDAAFGPPGRRPLFERSRPGARDGPDCRHRDRAGGAVRALTAHAVGLPKHDRLRIEGARNCSLTTLDYQSNSARLVGYNDDGHLPPALP